MFGGIKRPREEGVIAGFTALLDPSHVARSLLIFVEVMIERTTAEIVGSSAAAARLTPEGLERPRVASGFDH